MHTEVIPIPARFNAMNGNESIQEMRFQSRWNAVVKIEDVEFEDNVAIVSIPIAPMQHIRFKGEDFSEGTLFFAADHVSTHQIFRFC